MDLPNKSDTGHQPKKDIKPVISGATQVPRPATRRFLDYVFAESPKKLGAKIGRDIVIPRIKAGFEEAANSFLSGMLWGPNGGRPISNIVQGTVLRAGGMNYNAISQQPSAALMAAQANQTRSSGNYQDLVCGTQQQAEVLLANMFDLLNQYRVVTVADLYELANITPAISDGSYGWTSLEGARIVKSAEGYVLQLPRPILI